jgi:hypothetical protein
MEHPRTSIVARILQVVCLLGAAAPASGGSPCDTVSRDLPSERKAVLAPEIAKQLNVTSVDVLQSFTLGSWQIIYVNTHESDEPFLFYSGDPLKTRYVTMWAVRLAYTKNRRSGRGHPKTRPAFHATRILLCVARNESTRSIEPVSTVNCRNQAVLLCKSYVGISAVWPAIRRFHSSGTGPAAGRSWCNCIVADPTYLSATG